MKKIWLWMISSILFFAIGIPVHVVAEEKAFDPTDFSTYGLGMKESIGQESTPPYQPPTTYVPKQEWQHLSPSKQKQQKYLPERVDLRSYFPSVRNQGRFATCVPFAATALREYYIGRDTTARGADISYLSPLYMYYPRGPKDGMRLEEAFQSMQYQGVTPEMERPYDLNPENTAQFQNPITNTQWKQALPYQIRNYQLISQSNMVAQIKQALAHRDPVMVGIYVYPNFDATPSSGIVPPVTSKKSRGGHALVVVGYDEKNNWFILRNSWGEKFGDQGYVYMNYQTLLDMTSGYGFVVTPVSYWYPPQGVQVKHTLTRDGKNQFHITALQAQQFDLYRDGTYIKSFWENSMIDEETDPTKEHTYYIMAKNSMGETRSPIITVPSSQPIPMLQKAN
ncbi:C1 family peptidase [Bacillus thuringiensis]|uniref:C1 family peptidase n=1 Tax=Bacillus thuringiensis TaxID=1428 RepID=UPI0025A65F22|nr:C1 family peptidase [Bacillus thuringiensis]MDM8365469.1 C1 family peptidase [Bacillus thuringiensis]